MKIFKNFVAHLAANFAFPFFIRLVKITNHIHLDFDELYYIATVLKKCTPCRFLVFGFGNDSLFWDKINRSGTTVFLEDNQNWFHKTLELNPQISGYLVSYGTIRSQWQELLFSPEKLTMNLPEEVKNMRFDCILVDGPQGWLDSDPGRMKSIFMASQLIGEKGNIFVHDCDRIIEMTYCNQYLRSGKLIKELNRLRHYYFPSPISDL